MTETYHGPHSEVYGDRPKAKKADVYHRYPGSSEPSKVEQNQPVKAEQNVAQLK